MKNSYIDNFEYSKYSKNVNFPQPIISFFTMCVLLTVLLYLLNKFMALIKSFVGLPINVWKMSQYTTNIYSKTRNECTFSATTYFIISIEHNKEKYAFILSNIKIKS